MKKFSIVVLLTLLILFWGNPFLLIDLTALKTYNVLHIKQAEMAEQLGRLDTVSCSLSHALNRTGFENITSSSGVVFDNAWAKKNKDTYPGGDQRDINEQVVIDNMAGGVVAADFNGDGLVDLYFVSNNTGHLFQNRGNLKFKDVTKESGILPYQKGTGALAADYDNDGKIDLLLYGYKSSPKLYRNIGGMKFEDVTEKVGLEREGLITFGAAFADYNKDGWLDLYLVNYLDWPKVSTTKGSFAAQGQANILFRNNKGVFEDVTVPSATGDKSPGLAATFVDFNNDGWPDILIANDLSPNSLYKNNGDGTFANVSPLFSYKTGTENDGMGIATGDYNNDGWMDAYISNIYQDKKPQAPGGNLLFINKKGQELQNTAKENHADIGGWGWGTVPIDYNNDGLTDIAEVSGFSSANYKNDDIGTIISKQMVDSKAYFYENQGNAVFKEKACELGFVSERNGRGLVWADLDNDGYPDLIVNELRRQPQIFRNLGGKNNWLEVKLVGKSSNRDGIGAKVWVNDGVRTQMKELETSGTYLSSSQLILHFGLGKSQAVKELKILWPSGTEQIVKNTQINKVINAQEK